MPVERGWYQLPMRWGQINIREHEPPQFDVAWWAEFWRSCRLDGITLNAGGIWAYYPTALADHHRSRWLGERDLFGELMTGAKSLGMRVLARIDPSLSHEDVYFRHPDWFSLDAEGKAQRRSELFVTCVNGPYYWQFIPEVVREIHRLYDVDGIFGNAWGGFDAVCHCPRCRQLFKNDTGHHLPAAASSSDMAWKRWVVWHQGRLGQLWQFWDRLTKEIKPGTTWMGNSAVSLLAEHADMINVDQQSRREHQPLWLVSESGKKMRALTRGKPYYHIFSSNSYSRHMAKPEAEHRLYIADALMADSRPWFTIIGGVQDDRRQFGPIEAMYRWHAAHAADLRDRRSLAEVALAFYDRDRFVPASQRAGDAFRGFYYALMRYRIPFDLVHASRMDEQALAPYKLLILPNIAALSDAEAENVRRFVSRGGALIATYAAGLCDEWGEPRRGGALDDLLGVAARGPCIGPLEHSYALLHGPHPLLAGLEGTEITLNGGFLASAEPAPGVDALPLTLIPPYPSYPPETAFSRTGDVGRPLVLLSEGAGERSRRVYFPGNLDAFFWATNGPDQGRLLSNAVRWAFPGEQPTEVIGPGLIDWQPYRQGENVQVHLVNLTNPDIWKAPVHEMIPIGAQRIRVRLPQGGGVAARARCLVSGRTLPVVQTGGWAEVELPELVDHEVVVFEGSATRG